MEKEEGRSVRQPVGAQESFISDFKRRLFSRTHQQIQDGVLSRKK